LVKKREEPYLCNLCKLYRKKSRRFADATARIGLCPLWIASNMELRHTHIIVEKTI